MKAISSPGDSDPPITLRPPNQKTMASAQIRNTSITPESDAWMRTARSSASKFSTLPRRNRSSSCSSVAKARTTRMAENASAATAVRSASRSCTRCPALRSRRPAKTRSHPTAGSTTMISRVSRQLMKRMKRNIPTKVTALKTSSTKVLVTRFWSVATSPVMRLISSPTREACSVRSDMRCIWS